MARDQKLPSGLANEIAAKTGRQAAALAADITVKTDLKHAEERMGSDSNAPRWSTMPA